MKQLLLACLVASFFGCSTEQGSKITSTYKNHRTFQPEGVVQEGKPPLGLIDSASDPLFSQFFYLAGQWALFSEIGAEWLKDLNGIWYYRATCPGGGGHQLLYRWVGQKDPCESRHEYLSYQNAIYAGDFDRTMNLLGIDRSSDQAGVLFLRLISEVRAFYAPAKSADTHHGWMYFTHRIPVNDFWMTSSRWGWLAAEDNGLSIQTSKGLLKVLSLVTNPWYLYNLLTAANLSEALEPSATSSVALHLQSFPDPANHSYVFFGRGLQGSSMVRWYTDPESAHLNSTDPNRQPQIEPAFRFSPFQKGIEDYGIYSGSFYGAFGLSIEVTLKNRAGTVFFKEQIQHSQVVASATKSKSGVCAMPMPYALDQLIADRSFEIRVSGALALRVGTLGFAFDCTQASMGSHQKLEITVSNGRKVGTGWVWIEDFTASSVARGAAFVGLDLVRVGRFTQAELDAKQSNMGRCSILSYQDLLVNLGIPTTIQNQKVGNEPNNFGICRLAKADLAEFRSKHNQIRQEDEALLVQQFRTYFTYNNSASLFENWGKSRQIFSGGADYWLSSDIGYLVFRQEGVYHWTNTGGNGTFRLFVRLDQAQPYHQLFHKWTTNWNRTFQALNGYDLFISATSTRPLNKVLHARYVYNWSHIPAHSLVIHATNPKSVSSVTVVAWGKEHVCSGIEKSNDLLIRCKIETAEKNTLACDGSIGSQDGDHRLLGSPSSTRCEVKVQWSGGATDLKTVASPADDIMSLVPASISVIKGSSESGYWRMPFNASVGSEFKVDGSPCYFPNDVSMLYFAKVGCFFQPAADLVSGQRTSMLVQQFRSGKLVAARTVAIYMVSDKGEIDNLAVIRENGSSLFLVQGVNSLRMGERECQFVRVNVPDLARSLRYDGYCFTDLAPADPAAAAIIETSLGVYDLKVDDSGLQPTSPQADLQDAFAGGIVIRDTYKSILKRKTSGALDRSAFVRHPVNVQMEKRWDSCQETCNQRGLTFDANGYSPQWCSGYTADYDSKIGPGSRWTVRAFFNGTGAIGGGGCTWVFVDSIFRSRWDTYVPNPVISDAAAASAERICKCTTFED